MTTAGKAAFGTLLKIGANAIAEVTNITLPQLTAGDVDMTNMSSADGYKEFIQGLKDGGELSIEANYIVGDTNGQVALMTLFNSGAIQAFIVTFPGAPALAHWDFSGYVKAIATTANMDGKIGFTCAIKLTGKPTLTAGAPA